jgi:hypothetical protein
MGKAQRDNHAGPVVEKLEMDSKLQIILKGVRYFFVTSKSRE